MIAIIELLAAVVVSIVATKVFAQPKTPAYIQAATTVCYSSVLLSFCLLLTDILVVGTTLTNWWRFVYWTQFMMSYLVLPFLLSFDSMDYIKNGPERFYASLSKVMKVYFVYAVVGVLAYCGWTYFFENQVAFTSLCITLSTVWGLLQISFLMGYGLILLPQSFVKKDLLYLYELELCKIDQHKESKHQATLHLDYLIATAKGIKGLRLTQDNELLESILSKFSEQRLESVPATVLSDDIDDTYKRSIVALHHEVKRAIQTEAKAQQDLEQAVQLALKYEAQLKETQYQPPDRSVVRQFGIRTVLVVLTFFSIGLLIAEILAGFNFGADTGYLSIPILAYMVAVTIYGLFSLKIGVYYALEYRNSQSSSLLYSAKMLTAIAPALLFNFLMVCHINSTQFTEFMHSALNVKLVIIAPFAIALTMIVNQWGLWSRVMIALGMEELALSVVHDPQRVESGRLQLDRLQRQANQRNEDEL